MFNLIKFQVSRLDPQQLAEWEFLINNNKESISKELKIPVDSAAFLSALGDLTDWALIETALGKTAIHYNIFNLAPEVGSEFNYFTTCKLGSIREGGMVAHREKLAKFRNEADGLLAGVRQYTKLCWKQPGRVSNDPGR